MFTFRSFKMQEKKKIVSTLPCFSLAFNLFIILFLFQYTKRGQGQLHLCQKRSIFRTKILNSILSCFYSRYLCLCGTSVKTMVFTINHLKKKKEVKLKNEQLYKTKYTSRVGKLNKLKRVVFLHKSLCKKNWICDTYVRIFIDWQTDNSCIQSNISLSEHWLICWEINKGNRSREDKRKEEGKLKS